MSSGPLAPNVALHTDESDEVTTLDAGPGVMSTPGKIHVAGAFDPNVYAVGTWSVESMTSSLGPQSHPHISDGDEVTTLEIGLEVTELRIPRPRQRQPSMRVSST